MTVKNNCERVVTNARHLIYAAADDKRASFPRQIETDQAIFQNADFPLMLKHISIDIPNWKSF